MQQSRAQQRTGHKNAAPLAVAEVELLLYRGSESADKVGLPDTGYEGHNEAEARQIRLAGSETDKALDRHFLPHPETKTPLITNSDAVTTVNDRYGSIPAIQDDGSERPFLEPKPDIHCD